ncbi:MAG: carbohydrate ABC transporter permease [Halanaerobiales bacterium]
MNSNDIKNQLYKYNIGKFIVQIFMALVSLVMVTPFLWMFLSALKTQKEIKAFPPTLFPDTAMWGNFIETWLSAPFNIYIFNSFFTATSIVILHVVTTAMFAYAITQLTFKLRGFLFALIMATYMLPVAVTYVPSYIILARLGWLDSYQGIIFSNSVSVFAIFLARQSFLQVPQEMVDAAKVDGAGHWHILWHVFLPLTKPIFITFGLINFVLMYNNYLWPLMIIRSQEMYLITIGLRQFFIEQGAYGVNWPLIMAASTIVVTPLLLLFFAAQKWFIKGVGGTGIKG